MRKILAVIVFSALNTSAAFALDGPPPAYRTDPSKPDALSHVSPAEANTTPVSARSQTAWENYSSPLANCIQGHTIIPATGNDLFSVLFHNDARVNITMAIQGWNKNLCQVNFSEATHVMYCKFNKYELKSVIGAILAASQFDPSSETAQIISSNCTPTPIA